MSFSLIHWEFGLLGEGEIWFEFEYMFLLSSKINKTLHTKEVIKYVKRKHVTRTSRKFMFIPINTKMDA